MEPQTTEQTPQQTPSTTQQTQQSPRAESPSGATMTREEIAEQARKAALEAISEGGAVNKSSEVEIERRVRSEIARSIAGEPAPDELDPLVAQLLTKPKEVLGHVIAVATETALEQVNERKSKDDLRQKAHGKVLGERPDVMNNKAAFRAVADFYETTDSKLGEEERAKEALRKYDLLMEEQGLGDAKARIAKASSVPNASAQPTAPQVTLVDESKMLREELDEDLAHFRKTRGQT